MHERGSGRKNKVHDVKITLLKVWQRLRCKLYQRGDSLLQDNPTWQCLPVSITDHFVNLINKTHQRAAEYLSAAESKKTQVEGESEFIVLSLSPPAPNITQHGQARKKKKNTFRMNGQENHHCSRSPYLNADMCCAAEEWGSPLALWQQREVAFCVAFVWQTHSLINSFTNVPRRIETHTQRRHCWAEI